MMMLSDVQNSNAMMSLSLNEATPSVHALDQSNNTLSVIIRFHQEKRLAFLEEAIFSLALQGWHDIEVIVVLQNGTDEIREKVIDIINRQPWPREHRYKTLLVPIPTGVDGRSTLLNQGIENANGRYLAFLDDDDFVYQHGYSTLINQLITGGAAVAVGGCRRANIQNANDHWYVQSKDNFFAWGRSRFDMFRENFVPIHSYVIDRFRLGSFNLYFDDACPPLEDYDFLLRLFAWVEPDFAQLDVPVCEYRIRLDGSNSIAYTENAPPEVIERQELAQALIKARKKHIILSMPPDQQKELREGVCAELFKEPDLHESPPDEPTPNPTAVIDNLMVQQITAAGDEEGRVLLQITQKLYLFFGRHPWWELQLSRLLHWTWRRSFLRPQSKEG